MTAQNETAALAACVLMDPRTAWRSQEHVDAQWHDLGFTGRPDHARACDEHDAFAAVLEGQGVRVQGVPAASDLTLDAIYVRDASVVSDRGVVLCRMGKTARRGEPAAQGELFEALGIPVLGGIRGPGRLEGGDCVWLDGATLAVGLGYRTNAEGARQLGDLLGPGVEIVTVPLPHWRGPGDVFHLMSILSPLDDDLALVYSPLMPVPFREGLRSRGYEFVEVPDEEVDMGANALALGPRRCLLEAANTRTRGRLESAGVEVIVYDGAEISRKGLGGPTCLTRPIERLPEA